MSAKGPRPLRSAGLRAILTVITLVFSLAAPLAAQPAPAGAGRLALVIGNGAYSADPLLNPPNDAEDIAEALRAADFQVNLLVNANQSAMEAAVNSFAASLRGADAGLFYYSGHGVQVDGMNFLIPVASGIDDAASVKAKAVAVDTVVGKMEASGVRTALIFLDSCRDNPFPGAYKSGTRGLAVVHSPKTINSLIAYATSPGETAADGVVGGRNGVFSGAVLKYLREPGLELSQLMRNVKAEVSDLTNGKQQPRVDDGMKEDFYFVSPELAAARAKLAADTAAAELAALEAAIAEREKAIAAAKDARVKADLEIAQQTAKALETIKRLAADRAKAEADRTAKEAARKAAEAAVRYQQATEAAAQAAALKQEAEAKRAEMASLERADDSAAEFFRQIVTLTAAIQTITDRYAEIIDSSEKEIAAFYTTKNEEISRLVADPWENDKEFQARLSVERAKLNAARDSELASSRHSFEIERDANNLELRNKLQAAETALVSRCWSLSGPDLAVSFSSFDRDKKGWPVTISSRLPDQRFTAKFFYDISSAADLPAVYNAVDTAIKAGAYAAELDYSFVKETGNELYIAVVEAVRLIDLTASRVVLSRTEPQKWYSVNPLDPTVKNYLVWTAFLNNLSRQIDKTIVRIDKTNVGWVSLTVGVLGAVVAGTAYSLGSQAGAEYDAALRGDDATAARSRVQFYRGLFGTAAGLGAAGLIIGPFLLFSGSNQSALNRDITNLGQ